MMQDLRSRLRVYVLTSSGLVPGRGHADVARAALEGGATALQLRAPELSEGELLPLASGLAALRGARGVLFIVNDALDVAVGSGADGAHVGQGDDPARARAALGPGRILGVSVTSPEEAWAAEALGADHLSVTVWESSTKPEAKPAGLEGLRAVVLSTFLPIVGIGGIDASNAGDVIAAGAAGVAVVSAVGAARDMVAATRALADAVQVAMSARGGKR